MSESFIQERAIAAIGTLPPLPQVAIRLVKLVNEPLVSASDVAALISTDVSITAKLLRLANSAFYGIPRTITTVQNAVVILGMKVVNSLVLGVAVNQTFAGKAKTDLDQNMFWSHSLATAAAAKRLAPLAYGMHPVEPEEAFCAGLMHDLGQLVLDRFFTDEFAQILSSAKQKSKPLSYTEEQHIGHHHGEIGGWLTSKWELPTNLRMPIIYHHTPLLAPHGQSIAIIVAIANALAHQSGYHKFPEEAYESIPAEWLNTLGLDDDDLGRVLSALPADVEQLESAFS